MEIRAFAERILLSDSLEEKLARIEEPITDDEPGEALRVQEPERPAPLKFAPRRAAPQMPHPQSFSDVRKRAVAHHIMANHELQALEVMAFVLCAFPDAPSEFRRGLLPIMADEQRHTRMHRERAAKLGITFGELPVNCYIWKKALDYTCVLDYLAGLPLTFEGRNLDHTLELEAAFLAVEDQRSATLMRKIHDDEIHHVAFGLEWLRKLKDESQTDWEAYEQHLHWPLRPAKSKGNEFDIDSRKAAGMTDEFIANLQNARDETRNQN